MQIIQFKTLIVKVSWRLATDQGDCNRKRVWLRGAGHCVLGQGYVPSSANCTVGN